ncbi:diguanylate cyclase [Salipiger sp. H15]|uniref:diguanylate cyclase n=1 Tax=Alloyangia sp. H15 TaxID=3029062 RepID=A0AAU8AER8_9RHOB
MAGRILIVEGTAGQRILLRARLTSAFYRVAAADSGAEALRLIADRCPDLVIAAADLPDMCSSSFCTRLRALPDHAETPLVLLSEEDRQDERLALLAVGADDVIARQVEDILLLARLRSLMGRSHAQDELRLRDDTKRALGLSESPRGFQRPARVAMISLDPALDPGGLAARLRIGLGAQVQITEPGRLLHHAAPAAEVVVLVDTGAAPGSGLALLAQLRTARAQRRAALVYVTAPGQDEIAARALDLGADDLLRNGADPLELELRLPRLVNLARRADRHRAALRTGLRAAVIDPLTGLYNRRYALPQLARMAQQAARLGRPLALLVADLDHFKQVNDLWGHSVGDHVLTTTAQTLSRGLRDCDLVARLGGEEFLIALADTGPEAARNRAHALCDAVARQSLRLPDGLGGRRTAAPTISIGLTVIAPGMETVETALRRADAALYAAKKAGRNRAHLSDPAVLPPQPAAELAARSGDEGPEPAAADQSRGGLRGRRRASSSSSSSSRSA